MRVDLALKYLCLAKSRSIAKSLCDEGRVLVNGSRARASSNLRAGDFVVVRFSERTLILEILAVPEKQMSKADAAACYRARPATAGD